MDLSELSLQLVNSIEAIGKESWDRCHDGSNPFVSYEFLHALEASGSANERNGWSPHHVVVSAGTQGAVVACCPLYIKTHSYGEYVFDHGWAEAYEVDFRTGRQPHYYPKAQSCVPFTPVTSNKILLHRGIKGEQRSKLFKAVVDSLAQLPSHMGICGLHITFCERDESDVMAQRGFLQRIGVQYHWLNSKQGDRYSSFEDFLRCIKQKRRKSIRQERKKVSKEVVIKQLTGDDLKDKRMWDAFYTFYCNTIDKKWGTAYLTREFFDIISMSMADRILMVVAYKGEVPVAAALNFIGTDALYGRNWGCQPGLYINSLHFELCYYQAIDFAISHGLSRVEAGAQGEHKVQRGYLPQLTYSNHFFTDVVFSQAVERFLTREQVEINAYVEALTAHDSPFIE